MKFKQNQEITYRNGDHGIILTAERYGISSVVSMANDGCLHTHTKSGAALSSMFDIMPPVPQGEELVGMLCGFSDIPLEKAKGYAMEAYVRIGQVMDYNASSTLPYCNADRAWKYAYPVPKERLEMWLKKAGGMK